ncbi:CBS domain-containing protein [Aurantimonas sp. A3-2-R12]|uniref:CBS domain-containing protein n=1 Tax=Aurantimonas sp. A3-2-R12 TaxID=3114362 RepID=UPI002E19EAA0|nr:CBS domain-containing protein [Aurantimonas sp. A3-2-R12]
MIERPRIDDYMSRDLITLTPGIEINHAMNILLDRRLSGAPVLDETGRLVGVLSKKDCLKAALHASYFQEWGGTVRDYMSQNVETLDAGTDIVEAANAFLASPFRRFPVMRNGKLVGQVSRADILRALRDCWD